MKRVSLGEIFSASVEWTKTLFLRPFSFKKWALFFIIAMLAFELQGGLNLRVNSSSRGPAKEAGSTPTAFSAQPSPPAAGRGAPGVMPGADKTMRSYAPLFIGLGILALLVFLLAWWLRSVFLFVFIESIADNDASIRKPFGKNRAIGSSYFAWAMLFLLLFLATLLIPLKLGYDVLVRFGVIGGTSTASIGAVALALLPHILSVIALFVIAGLASLFMEDYIAIVMCKTRASLPKAAPEAFRLFFESPTTTIKYILFKVALAIAVSIITTVISFLALVTFLSPVIIVGIGLGFLYRVIPAPVRAAFFIILALAGVPVIIAIIFVANMIFTPLSFFYKTFNMKFIARLDDTYDLFKAT